MLGIVAALLAGALALARQDTVFLVGQALRTDVLLGALAANGAILLFRGYAIVDAWRLGRRPARRPARVAVLGVLLAIAALPHALAAWYQWTAYDAVTSIFADVDPADITARAALPEHRRPEHPARQAPGARGPRGGRGGRRLAARRPAHRAPARRRRRAGPLGPAHRHDGRRHHRRPHPARGAAVAAAQHGRGARAAGGGRPGARRALPRHPQRPLRLGAPHPELFPGRDPGATALKQVAANLTGLRVDYYALVDFRGFVEMVDALGGVTVNVPRPVLDRVSPPEDGQDWIRIDLQPGRQRLTALRGLRLRPRTQPELRLRAHPPPALRAWSRSPARPIPARVLRAFPRLAAAARENVSTDIPRRVLPRLVELVAGIDRRKIVSLGFVPAGLLRGLGRPRLPGARHPGDPRRHEEGDRAGRDPRARAPSAGRSAPSPGQPPLARAFQTRRTDAARLRV